MSNELNESDIAQRLERLDQMMSEALAKEHPAGRDRRMQRFMAQGMTPARRLELLAQICEVLIPVGRK